MTCHSWRIGVLPEDFTRLIADSQSALFLYSSPETAILWRSMLAQGAYQVDLTSERIKLGLDRARAEGKRMGCPPALSPDQTEQCRRMAEEGAGLWQISWVM